MSYRISETWHRVVAVGCLGLSLVLHAGAGTASAQADAATDAPPASPGISAEIVTPAAAASATVGDPIALTLRVTHPEGTQVILPQLAKQWGDVEVLAQSPASTSAGAGSALITEQTIDVVSFAPGDVQTPPLVVTMSDAAGQVSQAAAAPVTLAIASVLAADDSELRDIKPQAVLELPAPVPTAPLAVAAGALALGLLSAVIWRRRDSKHLVDNRTAEQMAADELAKIGQMKLPAAGRTDEQYALASTCLRSYVERQYHVPALDATTQELADHLRSAPISALLRQLLIGLLRECDLVKFAGVTPDTTEAGGFLEDALRFVVQSAAEIAAVETARQQASTHDTVAAPAGA